MLPKWFRQPIPDQGRLRQRTLFFEALGVDTICRQAHCPNQATCLKEGEATFLILGDTCSRGCRFCAVEKGVPRPVRLGEPYLLELATRSQGLSYIVITAVSRDDLKFGGATQFSRTVWWLRSRIPGISVELLIPDFKAQRSTLSLIASCGPQVLGHNVETVPRLYPRCRPRASYRRSLRVLELSKKFNPHMLTKSALLLGMGEIEKEVRQVMQDLRSEGCDILVLGQYLSPGRQYLPVQRFLPLEEFARYEARAWSMGFKAVLASPLARSSYQAQWLYRRAMGESAHHGISLDN